MSSVKKQGFTFFAKISFIEGKILTSYRVYWNGHAIGKITHHNGMYWSTFTPPYDYHDTFNEALGEIMDAWMFEEG